MAAAPTTFQTSPQKPGQAKPWLLRILLPLLGWTALAGCFITAQPHLPELNPAAAIIFSVFFFTALCAAHVYLACKDGPFPKNAWIAGAAAMAVNLALSFYPWGIDLPPLSSDTRLLAGSVLLLFAAPLLGELLSRAFAHKEYLVPAMMVAVAADIWSVFFGVSKALLETGAHKNLIVSFPTISKTDSGSAMLPTVGVTDWVIVACLVCFVIKFRLRKWELLPAAVIGLWGGLIAVNLLRIPMPYMITIGLGFVLCYLPQILPRWRDLRTTLIFLAVMALSLSCISILRPKQAAQQQPPAQPEKATADKQK